MGVETGEQLRLLAAALLLGMALALLYDLLRALRLRRREETALTASLDIIFCVALALSLLVFALRIGGGELRLYALLAAAVGSALYFSVFSPLLRPMWDFWARTLIALVKLLRAPLMLIKKFHTNLHKIMKRLFIFCRSSFIIASYRRYARRARRIADRREGAVYGGKAKKRH